jgi:hypothetical protein
MTRLGGSEIFSTPCCGAFVSSPIFDSLNFTSREHWTDGRSVDGLVPDTDIKKCSCGSVFLLSQAESVGVIRKSIQYKEASWDLKLEAWLRKKKEETTQKAMERLFRVRPKDCVEQPEIQIPPPAKHLDDSELALLLNNEDLNTDLMIVARRRLWRYLNDPYRSLYRQHRAIDPNSLPAYEPSAAQTDNMLRLTFMLEADKSADPIEISELYREAGEFKKSLKFLDCAKDQSNNRVEIQRRLCDMLITAPVSYDLRNKTN